MSQIRQHLLLSLVSSNAIMVINFVTSIVLARMLTPTEIGVFSVAFVFAGLLRAIREFGIGAYIVQEPELTATRMRSALGIAFLLSLLTGAALAIAAPYVGAFYRDDGITEVLHVIAASMVLAPLGSTSLALLRRDLRFKEIAIAETFATVVQCIASVVLAWLGFGYMSLAWSSVIGILASIAAAFYYRPANTVWLPGLAEWRRVLDFCRFVSGSSLLSNFNASISDLVLGRMLNTEAVALFNRAQSLADLIGPILMKATNAVSLPYFVKAKQDGVHLGDLNSRSSSLIAAVSVPTYCVLAILAEPLIALLYGEQWQASAPVLQILCLGAIVRTPITLSSQILTAIGEVRRVFILDTQALVVKVLLVVAAAPFGLTMVAWAFLLSSIQMTVQRIYIVAKTLNTPQLDAWRSLAPSFFPTLLASIGPLTLTLLEVKGPWLLPAAGVLALVGWLIGALLRPSPIKDELMRLRSRLPGL